MSDIHFTPELMAAVKRGDLHLSMVLELGWNHLMHLCPTCRAGMQACQEEMRDRPADYAAAFRLLPLVLGRHAADQEEIEAQAERDLRDLLDLPQKERLTRIHRASRRFRGVSLAHHLLNEARRHMPVESHKVHDLAVAAEQVLLRTPDAPGYFDALARATAYRANALRAGGKMREADERMATVRSLIRHQNVTETLVYAEVDAIEGVLRKDQRRFKESEPLLARSVALFELAGEKSEAARPLIALGLLYYDQKELAKAATTTEAALAAFSPESDPRLYLCGRFNLALFHAESGRYAAAAEFLQEDEALYQEFTDPWTVLRKLWLSGKIARALGRLAEAESAFLQVRAGFIEQGIGYDAEVVARDLALLALQRRDAGSEVSAS